MEAFSESKAVQTAAAGMLKALGESSAENMVLISDAGGLKAVLASFI